MEEVDYNIIGIENYSDDNWRMLKRLIKRDAKILDIKTPQSFVDIAKEEFTYAFSSQWHIDNFLEAVRERRATNESLPYRMITTLPAEIISKAIERLDKRVEFGTSYTSRTLSRISIIHMDEGDLEEAAGKRTRPYKEYRKHILGRDNVQRAILSNYRGKSGSLAKESNWDQVACCDCGCSPGFTYPGPSDMSKHTRIYVTGGINHRKTKETEYQSRLLAATNMALDGYSPVLCAHGISNQEIAYGLKRWTDYDSPYKDFTMKKNKTNDGKKPSRYSLIRNFW